MAIALAAVGGIAPWIGAARTETINGIVGEISLGCLVMSATLHLLARRILRQGLVV